MGIAPRKDEVGKSVRVFLKSFGYLMYRKVSMKVKKQKRTMSSIWMLVSAAFNANTVG